MISKNAFMRTDYKRRFMECSLSHDEGWTFVETLIVIGIILILTTSVGFMAFRYIDRAKIVTAKNQIENMSMAMNAYYMDCKQYPAAEQGFDALWQKPTTEPIPENWTGPYVDKKITTDPWGHPYKYEVPGPNGLPFGILCYGADGVEGGDGNNKDISSWEN